MNRRALLVLPALLPMLSHPADAAPRIYELLGSIDGVPIRAGIEAMERVQTHPVLGDPLGMPVAWRGLDPWLVARLSDAQRTGCAVVLTVSDSTHGRSGRRSRVTDLRIDGDVTSARFHHLGWEPYDLRRA